MLAPLLLFASGACALVWQMVWTAGLGVALGHEGVAVLAVVAAFFGGLAAGSFLLAGAIERSARPAAWYAALEVAIGLWGLMLTLLLPSLAAAIARALGPEPAAWLHGLAAFGIPLVLLLPATLAMGATLPALERQVRAQDSAALPLLYAANTAGALTGLLLAIFVAIPQQGLQAAAWACAIVNVLCATAALPLGHGKALPPPAAAPRSRAGAFTLFATGLFGVGYEVLALRVLAQVCENTVYTYAILLAIFLAGTAAGAALLRRFAPAQGAAWRERLLLMLAFAVVASGAALGWADRLHALPSNALAGEALAGLAAMLLPSLVMGALFSSLCLQAAERGMSLGRAVGFNTLGSALAPALVGALAAPWLGARAVLVLLALGYVALAGARAWRSPTPAIVAALALFVAALGPALQFVDVPSGGRVLSYREGALGTVSVVADAEGVARLHIDNRAQEGSSASGMMETRLAQLPLLLHPSPREALFLGLGTGYTAHAAAVDPAVRVTAVELVPQVIEASHAFMLRPAAPRAAHPVNTVAADARRFVLADDRRYDVIVADLFHPARSGAASLYTAEHFRAVRERLAPGGVFCQWLALHQMDLDTLRSIVAAFLQVYPDGAAVLAGNSLDTPVVGLVARPGAPVWRSADVQHRFVPATPALTGALELARLDSAYAVLGSFIADANALRHFSGGATANTDDRPLVAQQAARVDYAPEATPRERLHALLQALTPAPAGVLERGDPASARLAAYWQARGRYIELGLRMHGDPDPRAMLDTLGPQLLDIVTVAPEFQPAADALAALAKGVEAEDYPLSQRVLAALRQAQSGAATRTPP